MNIRNTASRFSRSFKSFFSKQTNELPETQLDSFIIQSFNELVKSNRISTENYDEVIFLQKFDQELRQKLKSYISALLGRKITDKDAAIEGKQIAEILLNEFKRINEEISIEQYETLRKEVINSGSNIDANWKFYYDETNNPRKFWIKRNKFNSPVNKNFVLGGVVFIENEFNGNPVDLKNKLHLQKNMVEIKSKHILEETFIDSLKSKNLNKILKWISENELYIHFINIDNYYIAVQDILKIIIDNDLDNEKNRGSVLMYGHTLYKLMSSNIDTVREILKKHGYPNLQKEAITEFCEDWVILLKRLKSNLPAPQDRFEEMGNAVMYDALWKLFENVKNHNNFIGLGKEKYIVEDYSSYYTIKPDVFLNSFHIFDRETEIEKIIYADSDSNFEENKNFKFMDSTEDDFIQISDVIVGLLGRFFTYIEELNNELENEKIVQKLIDSISAFNHIQRENFLLLTNILNKSYNKNKLFFYSENTFVQRNNLEFILKIIEISDKAVMFKSGNN